MFEWLSDNRGLIAALLVLLALVSFVASIIIGRKQSAIREKDEVFGDPERNKRGWYWAVCGVSALFLIWFYYSWGTARAFFPQSANELCQVAKLDEALSPINAALPATSRYYKSTTLVARNREQLEALPIPAGVFNTQEQAVAEALFTKVYGLLALQSNPAQLGDEARAELAAVASGLNALAEELGGSDVSGLKPSAEALAQPSWGTTHIEIPLLPETARGVLFDQISTKAADLAKSFNTIRNHPPASEALIAEIKAEIAALKAGAASNASAQDARDDFLKSFERIFKRLDDGTIFPAAALNGVEQGVAALDSASKKAQGGLAWVKAAVFPGGTVVKSRTLCTEQGTGRWLPKPTDVVAQLAQLANPNLEAGGGFKGTTLLWWKWLPIADVVAFFIPDWVADIMPGDYARNNEDGQVIPNFKDHVLALAQGDVYLGAVPMLDGHIWDSLFRVLVALVLGVVLGVPLGIMMGVSRFFKSFFDPLIELYRPVPPLAWAPLILTIFGIQDDGKIFLLFMVAFAIMVISARTGASGTQLSKIRASHSLGASVGQILRHVILPNAMPEILTGIRIAIGVCWGTLVAAEMLAGTTGVGFIENVARTVSDYELIWVTILIMGVLGLVFDMIMRWVIHKTIPWRGKG